jgi:hypothetical protein
MSLIVSLVVLDELHMIASNAASVAWGKLPRTNVLTQLEKLAKATSEPIHEQYQWLCNAVHPSIGSMLSFASPMMAHETKMFAFQWVCEVPTVFEAVPGGNLLRDADFDIRDRLKKQLAREETIPNALAKASVFAIQVLEKTLDEALRIVDDVALTTRAPLFASFDYWRNVIAKSANSRCPCRSGRKVKQCFHRWKDSPPTVTQRFDDVALKPHDG